MKLILPLVLFVLACNESPLPPSADLPATPDAPVNTDLSVAPPADFTGVALDSTPPTTDLAGATCQRIAAAMMQYIQAHSACQHDSDCAEFHAPCGLPGTCAGAIEQSAVAGLQPFEQQWMLEKCLGGPCPSCPAFGPAACIGGTCQPLGPIDHPVGEPCSGDWQCHTEGQYKGVCLMGGTFAGGECVLPCAHGFACPLPGMYCRPSPTGAQPGYCYHACNMDADCRNAEGYQCCPPWGAPGGQPGNVCYPGPCRK